VGGGTSPLGGVEVRLTGLRHVLCIGAHSDDIEIGCGGTIIRLLEENPGLDIDWVVMSASDQRGPEARSSADSLLQGSGRAEVRIADFRESYFPYIGQEVKAYVDRLGSELKPDLIFTHWRGDVHQDHRILGELTWNAFRSHLILEYEIPKWDGDMGRPNIFMPLEQALCDRKIEHLLKAFPSQVGKDWFSAEVFWGLLRLRGMEARSPSGYAEAFHCSKLVLS
jgi:LmbE family N-acetylglucosaminyl deacetylase